MNAEKGLDPISNQVLIMLCDLFPDHEIKVGDDARVLIRDDGNVFPEAVEAERQDELAKAAKVAFDRDLGAEIKRAKVQLWRVPKPKLRWDLLPWGALEGVVRVFEHGATKHAEFGWKTSETARSCRNAALRHLAADLRGEELDESGEAHLDHAIARLLMVRAQRMSN